MNLSKSLLKLIGCCSLLALLSGCASVICGPKQAVSIDSKPHGAEVFVYDSHCDVILQETTPCTVKLARRTADYAKANYVILIKKEGFAPVQIPLTGEVNKAYFANILFGGLGLAVDPITGAMWTLSPDAIDPKVVSQNVASVTEGGWLVSLREDTSAPEVAQQAESHADLKAALDVALKAAPAAAQPAAAEVVSQAAPEAVQQPAPAAVAPEAAQQAAPEAAQKATPEAAQPAPADAGQKAASDVAQKPESQDNP